MQVKLNWGGEREANDPHKAPVAAKKAASLPREPSAHLLGQNLPKVAVASLALQMTHWGRSAEEHVFHQSRDY
jgi:hypothetical protein